MNKSLLALFALVFISQVLCGAENNATNSSMPSASKSGKLILYKKTVGYYLGADFRYDYKNAGDSFGPYTEPMMLGLYTSQTLLGRGCAYFNSYYCPSWDCTQSPNRGTEKYPYLTATGYYARANLNVDYSYWNLANTASALIADTCTYASYFYTEAVYGIVGMGRKGNNYYNFQYSYPIFSVYMQKNLAKGALIFSRDYSYASSSTPVVYFDTDLNWQGWLSGTLYVGGYTIATINTRTLFDVNLDAIGLPSNIFYSIVKYLSYYGIYCDSSYEKPSCTYNGYLSSMPEIYVVNGTFRDKRVSIPPQIYVKSSNTSYISQFTLNLRAIGSNYSGNNWVNPEFDNYIIYDSNFMAYYYTVFDASSFSSPRVYLYYASDRDASGSPWGIFAGVGVVAFFILVAICRCCYRPPKQVTVVTTTTQAPPTIVTPLIINEQPQYYAQNVQYAQQPYGYIQPIPQTQVQQPQIYVNPPTYNYGPTSYNQ